MRQAPDLEGARVLVVEDEYFMADDIASALEAAGGHTIGPASSIGEANALLAGNEVDAAILDINLDGEMAYPLISRLRADHVPCVIVTGYDEASLPESFRELPRLEKPAKQSAVITSVQAVLEPRP